MAFHNPDSFLDQFGRNKVLLAALLAWAVAQSLKMILGVIREKRFNFRWLMTSGGMPSSHVSMSMSLTTACGLTYGFDSGIFAVSLGFATITMFDAQGIRRHSGRQAKLLNKIVDDIYAHKAVEEARVKELLGHTPVEVFAGGALGILIAIIFYA